MSRFNKPSQGKTGRRGKPGGSAGGIGRPGGNSGNKPGKPGPRKPSRPGFGRPSPNRPGGGRPGQGGPQGGKGRPRTRPRPAPTVPATQEGMAEMLAKSGIRLDKRQMDQLWKYHNLLRKRNVGNELTRITGFEPMIIKHYVDCMIVGDLIKLPSPIVDVGSGPGFPGIPLKIRYPDLKMILAEPRPTRIDFLNEVWRELGMRNVTVFEHKVVSRSFQERVNCVITRAVEVMEKTVLRTSACLLKGGLLVFMKGPNCDEEIQIVQKRFGDVYKLVMDKAYRLPHTEHERRLVVWERLTDPDVVGAKSKPNEEEESYSPDGEGD